MSHENEEKNKNIDSEGNENKNEKKEEEKLNDKQEKNEEIDNEEKKEELENEAETPFSELKRDELIEYIISLEEKVSSLEEEKDKYYQKSQRLQADFVNYRKRTKREKESLSLEAKIEVVNEILPVLDSFERALSSEGDEDDFKTGVEMIYKQLINHLIGQGLEKISTEGKEFNHKYHEAIMQVEDCKEDSGIIVEEMQKGYMIEGKVIRPAMVKVAK